MKNLRGKSISVSMRLHEAELGRQGYALVHFQPPRHLELHNLTPSSPKSTNHKENRYWTSNPSASNSEHAIVSADFLPFLQYTQITKWPHKLHPKPHEGALPQQNKLPSKLKASPPKSRVPPTRNRSLSTTHNNLPQIPPQSKARNKCPSLQNPADAGSANKTTQTIDLKIRNGVDHVLAP